MSCCGAKQTPKSAIFRCVEIQPCTAELPRSNTNDLEQLFVLSCSGKSCWEKGIPPTLYFLFPFPLPFQSKDTSLSWGPNAVGFAATNLQCSSRQPNLSSSRRYLLHWKKLGKMESSTHIWNLFQFKVLHPRKKASHGGRKSLE